MESGRIIGSCTTMCPGSEIKMRLRERLVHFYERGDNGEPSADKMVKEYKRSAAGLELCKPEDLRTVETLRETVNYLLTSVIRDERRPYNQVYDFIFDRLRCIRQEIVISNLRVKDTIELLEPMIIFLAYSYYQLCDVEISKFDPKICGQHLQECLKKVLKCYDDLAVSQNKSTKRPLIEAIYLIFNLGSEEAMQRAVMVNRDPELRFDENILASWMISKYCWQGNYFRAIKHTKHLPVLLQGLIFAKHIQQWRDKLLKEFSFAYNSPNVSVPSDFLLRVIYVDKSLLKSLIDQYNLNTIPSSSSISIQFLKKSHRYDAEPLRPRKEIKMSFSLI